MNTLYRVQVYIMDSIITKVKNLFQLKFKKTTTTNKHIIEGKSCLGVCI